MNGPDDRRALWRELLDDARWAPSPHNIQPWLLRCRDDGTAEVSIPMDRLLPDTDPGGLFTGSGVGCLVQALAVAAGAHRLALTATPTGRVPGDPDPASSK